MTTINEKQNAVSMTPLDLSAIEARANAATPGKWVVIEKTSIYSRSGVFDGMRIADIRGWGFLTGSGALGLSDEDAIKMQDNNATFIAHARQDIPALIAAVRARDARIAELKAVKTRLVEADATIARPLSEYHEDMGDVLWWTSPIEEAPYAGTPMDVGQIVEVFLRARGVDKMMRACLGGWPGYHTHWTPLPARPQLAGPARAKGREG